MGSSGIGIAGMRKVRLDLAGESFKIGVIPTNWWPDVVLWSGRVFTFQGAMRPDGENEVGFYKEATLGVAEVSDAADSQG